MEIGGISHKIKVKPSPLHGMGVFAIEPLTKGEIIEVSYGIQMPPSEIPKNGVLRKYIFGGRGDSVMVGLGYSSIYNHSPNPNIIAKSYTPDSIQFTTLKEVEEGEELCHRYAEQRIFERCYL
jgi:SET domain-containing protein